ncbi:MAG: HD domain-containing protein [Limnobacter sp.]|uniref:HD domain-containing protein n=1 Tax=Limnobacter sp. TaxID=2003368 RepID=UPI00391C8D10
MHVVFISNCELKALPRTRALLDRYASRIGDRPWFTLITQDALDEVYSASRKSATRQTSIACYRNDSVLGMRLLWVVGNNKSYDIHGRFAVSTQTKETLRMPSYLRLAALVAQLAGYVHDLGKLTQWFQEKLCNSTMPIGAKGKSSTPPLKDYIRHEWISAWIMKRLESAEALDSEFINRVFSDWYNQRSAYFPAFNQPTPLERKVTGGLSAMRWAVATHHGAVGGELQSGAINCSRHLRPTDNTNQIKKNLTLYGAGDFDVFSGGVVDKKRWAELFSKINALTRRISAIQRDELAWEGVMVAARAALIMADHKVSSEPFLGSREAKIAYANTKQSSEVGSKPSRRYLDQPLSWHLLEVGHRAPQYLRILAGDELPAIDPLLVQAFLTDRAASDSRYAWQDRAADALSSLTESTGKLVFNVASTGAGKTLGNLKLAMAARPRSCRIAVAFNLRTLTTQTYDAFKHHFECLPSDIQPLFDRNFACLVGGKEAPRDQAVEDEDDLDSSEEIELEGASSLEPPSWMNKLAADSASTTLNNNLIKLLVAPALISTIDWIVSSGEPGQQDRHAKALIRVANSDLILDEVDSYDPIAAVAVMRVVKVAATFGRNVIVSSASLSPELAWGIATSYEAGRRVYSAMMAQPHQWALSIVHDTPDFSTVTLENPDLSKADAFYRTTMKELMAKVKSGPHTKRWAMAEVTSFDQMKSTIADNAERLHSSFCISPEGMACRISIGLVRVANVNPCMDIAEYLRADTRERFIVTAYHSRDVKARRSFREHWMDQILDRRDNRWLDALVQVCPWVKDFKGDVRLIVVATPVEEVGRDHDFDWAIIEPSSMHSIIQTSGRVNRHRRVPIADDLSNIVILSKNVRALNNPNAACFVRPGLEIKDSAANVATHPSYDMADLLMTEEGSFMHVVNASMIFDEGQNRTQFALCDSAGVKLVINKVEQILGRSRGFESAFMMAGFASKYPLRSREDGFLDFDLRIDMANREFFYVKSPGRRSAKDRLSKAPDGRVLVEAVPERTWLCGQLNPSMVHEASIKVPESKELTGIRVLWSGIKV